VSEEVTVHAHHAGAPAADSGFRGSSWQRGISLVARLGLGGVLILAGSLKIADPQQAALAVQAYKLLPNGVAEMVGYGLPLVELGIGVALIVGFGTRLMAIFTGALMVAFLIGVSSAWARGLSIDCGCFGGGGAVPEGTAAYLPEILRDVLFLALAVWLVTFPASFWALDRSGQAGTGDEGLFDELGDYDSDDSDDDDSDDDDSVDGDRHDVNHVANEETDR